MNYKIKALIQNAISYFPAPLDYRLYYFVQRKFGGLRIVDPLRGLEKACRIIELINKCGKPFERKAFLEVGTGRTLDFLVGLWLCGVGKIYTVDINPYLTGELVFQALDVLRENPSHIKDALPDFIDESELNERISSLIRFRGDLDDYLAFLGVAYSAPADAAHLDIPDSAIDYMVSTNVFEHIPKHVLRAILFETKRALSKDGLVVSIIDPSDHFSHSDRSLSSINFLSLTDREHDRLSGNKFMYHNRLRASDYYDLFQEVGLSILIKEEDVDTEATKLVESGFPVAEKFKDYTVNDLCVRTIHLTGTFLDHKGEQGH